MLFLHVAEGARLTLADFGCGLQTGMAEHDNLRAALEWTASSGETELGFRIAVASASLWVIHSPAEGVRWYERLLARAEGVPPELRAQAYLCQGTCAHFTGEFDVADPAFQQCLALFDRLGDEFGRVQPLQRLGISAFQRGELDRAGAYLEEALAIARRSKDPLLEMQVTGPLGALHHETGDLTRAFDLLTQTVTGAHERGVPWWEQLFLAERA